MQKARYSIFLSSKEIEKLIEKKHYLLQGDEFKHLAIVMKAPLNSKVDILSENGVIASAIISLIDKTKLNLSLISFFIQEKSPYTTILALAMPKNIRKTWILEKCVELKTSEILFWKGEHSQVSLQEKNNYTSIFQQAAKQCRNPYLPNVSYANSIEDVIQYARYIDAIPFFFYEKSNSTSKISLAECRKSTKPIVLIIGPEGGFSQNEVDIFSQNNILPYSLGNSILRYETAAFLALSLFYSINENIIE